MSETVKIPLMNATLESRMAKYGLVMPTFAPTYDRIFVHPLPNDDQPDTTSGGIVIPTVTKDSANAQRGVLLMAGPTAIEQLYSHGISLGDIVITSRFSPLQRKYFSHDRKPGVVLIARAAEIVGSEDLLTKLQSGEFTVTMDESGHTRLNDSEIIIPPNTED